MRLIDADKLYATVQSNESADAYVRFLLRHSPTIDAVEVVRCKDCKASRVYGKTTQWLACESVMEGQATDPDGYCYLGERKEP